MTISDKPEAIYELAERCPVSALVLTDAASAEIHFVWVRTGTEQADTARARAAGFTRCAGIIGFNRAGELERVSRPGLPSIGTMARAAIKFRVAILNLQLEFTELERMSKLIDPRNMGHA